MGNECTPNCPPCYQFPAGQSEGLPKAQLASLLFATSQVVFLDGSNFGNWSIHHPYIMQSPNYYIAADRMNWKPHKKESGSNPEYHTCPSDCVVKNLKVSSDMSLFQITYNPVSLSVALASIINSSTPGLISKPKYYLTSLIYHFWTWCGMVFNQGLFIYSTPRLTICTNIVRVFV